MLPVRTAQVVITNWLSIKLNLKDKGLKTVFAGILEQSIALLDYLIALDQA